MEQLPTDTKTSPSPPSGVLYYCSNAGLRLPRHANLYRKLVYSPVLSPSVEDRWASGGLGSPLTALAPPDKKPRHSIIFLSRLEIQLHTAPRPTITQTDNHGAVCGFRDIVDKTRTIDIITARKF